MWMNLFNELLNDETNRWLAIDLIVYCIYWLLYLLKLWLLQDCLKCNAKGRVACPPCDSYGQIRCYISLTISWKANTSEHIVEKSSLPADLIRQVSGQVVYEEEGARIAPLLHFPDPTISLASAQLLLNHNRQWPDKKMLAQVSISYCSILFVGFGLCVLQSFVFLLDVDLFGWLTITLMMVVMVLW